MEGEWKYNEVKECRYPMEELDAKQTRQLAIEFGGIELENHNDNDERNQRGKGQKDEYALVLSIYSFSTFYFQFSPFLYD